jgi:hypothetical protein
MKKLKYMKGSSLSSRRSKYKECHEFKAKFDGQKPIIVYQDGRDQIVLRLELAETEQLIRDLQDAKFQAEEKSRVAKA